MRLWDTSSRQELRILRGHVDEEGFPNEVGIAVFSPDGQTLISSDVSGTVKLWDPKSGKELKTFQGDTEPIRRVSFLLDGQTFVTGGYSGTVKLWSINGIEQQNGENKTLEDFRRIACEWMKNYLNTNTTVTSSERAACKEYLLPLEEASEEIRFSIPGPPSLPSR